MTEMQSLEIRTCPTVSTHRTTVSVPVSIVPFANPGTVSVQCSGTPEIGVEATPVGEVNGTCSFIISQTMLIEIPMVFGASVLTGETYVECGGTTGSAEGDCECEDEESTASNEE